jgi:hypothetical protein
MAMVRLGLISVSVRMMYDVPCAMSMSDLEVLDLDSPNSFPYLG